MRNPKYPEDFNLNIISASLFGVNDIYHTPAYLSIQWHLFYKSFQVLYLQGFKTYIEVDMVKGIIFDFNGTLYFDTDKQEEAWQILFKKYHGRDIQPTEFRDYMHGRVNTAIMDYFLGESASEEMRYQVMSEKEEVYRQIAKADKENLHLVRGAAELFDDLKQRNIPFTIATASEISNVRFYFEAFPLKRWLSGPEAIVYDDGTFPGKPAPDIYLRAAALIGIKPADCMVVEDSLSGLKAAENAGAGKIIAVKSDQDTELIRQNKAVETIIEDFSGFTERFL
ncbi:MAG: HAD family hydrolase [Flexilinea sp.]